ncbi:MAG: DNA translocase FtsK 4TM domain-containing protein [Rhodospirillales bacterium]|nr:DNA translocase FtsK 4TM domain-containing protein [Rhodospirillales bacterium]
MSLALPRGFLPGNAHEFIRRRLSELAGLALAVMALLGAAVLSSYDPADPSLNHATDGPVRNLMGPWGAVGADIAVQMLGWAPALVPAVLLAWAFRFMLNRGLTRPARRLLVLVLAVLLTAPALAVLPTPSWPLRVGPGGAFGDTVLATLLRIGLPGLGVAMTLAGIVGLLVLYALGLSWQEWRQIGEQASRATAASRVGMVEGVAWARRLLRRRQAEELPPAPVPRLRERREPRLDPGEAGPNARAGEAAADPKPARRKQSGDVVVQKPSASKRPTPQRQAQLDLGDSVLPPLDLLTEPSRQKATVVNEEALQQNARLLETVLDDFGVKGEIVKVRPGPVVTLYELEPAPGIKASRIIGLADDIARSMSAVSVRVAVVPGRTVMGIELPNARAETVLLREILDSEAYEKNPAKLPLALGKDIGGAPVVADLAKMPHLLIAGTTGSGKSVGINTMILSILYRMPPEDCKFIMIDPKMLELSVYDGIPHLLAPVVTDPRKAIVALKWTVREMENRYRNMSKLGVRNIESYNARLAEARSRGEQLTRKVQTGFDPETGQPIMEEQPLDMTPLPFIVVVVDEMADLMLVAGKDIEAAIQRLAQMARAAGIHLIMATQRPSVDVITGTIKANFPTRISFQVTSKIDSRTILGEGGAEQLLGRGDMLYMAGGGRITRVHAPFVGDKEVEAVVSFLKAHGEPTYLDEVTEETEGGGSFGGGAGEGGESDALYDQAVALVCRERKASTSFIQRHLQIGYNRAARLIERMEAEGVVSPANHVGKREVLARNIEN